MEFSIRRVREEDAESIVELLNPIIRAGKYTIMDEELSVDDHVDFIRKFPERGVYNVAISKESLKVLGIQDVQPKSNSENALKHVGEISTFVSLASQRKGRGRSLSKKTFKDAKQQGFNKIFATIRADNPQEISFYRIQGFEVIGTAQKHAFVRGRYIDEVFMEKFL
jgi:L-amino acid N-acyltransferase YncA